MAIKVYFEDDRPYAVADTIEEVAALLKLTPNGRSPRAKRGALSLASVSTKEVSAYDFFAQINENARKLLLALLKHEKGVRGDAFSKETHIEPEKFGGIFGGASKIAKNNGLKIEHFVISEFVAKGSERYRFYRPGKLLLEYADKLKHIAEEGDFAALEVK